MEIRWFMCTNLSSQLLGRYKLAWLITFFSDSPCLGPVHLFPRAAIMVENQIFDFA